MLAGGLSAPYAWLARWGLVCLLPNSLLGRPFSFWLLMVINVLVAVVWAVAVWRFEQWAPARRTVGYAAMGLAGFGWFFIPVGALWLHGGLGSPFTEPSDCVGLSPLVPEVCEGRDRSFLQGRHRFVRIHGRADGGMCQKLADVIEHGSGRIEHPRHTCQLERVDGWSAAPCSTLGIAADWNCYVCSERGSSGDSYHQMLAFDRRCRKGTAYITANVTPQEVPEMIDRWPLLESLRGLATLRR